MGVLIWLFHKSVEDSMIPYEFQGKPGIPAEWTWIDRHLEMFEASSSIGHKLLGKGAMKNPGFFSRTKLKQTLSLLWNDEIWMLVL